MKRALLTVVLVLTVFITSLSTPIAQSSANQDQYLRVKFTTISNPIVRTTAIAQEVTFTAFIETDGYQLVENDLTCNDGPSTIPATSIEVAQNDFSVSCTFKYDNSSQSGLRTIFLSARYAPPEAPSLKLIPANSKIIYPIKEKDSFGQTVIKSVSAFDILLRRSVWLGTPIAINPPQAFKYPSFPQVFDVYTVFDVRNPKPVNFNVTINKRSKTFSSNCADQTSPGLSKETIIYRKDLLWGGWGPYAISTKKSAPESYLTSNLIGKKLNLSCTYLISLKNAIYEGIHVSYVESSLKTVQFPKK